MPARSHRKLRRTRPRLEHRNCASLGRASVTSRRCTVLSWPAHHRKTASKGGLGFFPEEPDVRQQAGCRGVAEDLAKPGAIGNRGQCCDTCNLRFFDLRRWAASIERNRQARGQGFDSPQVHHVHWRSQAISSGHVPASRSNRSAARKGNRTRVTCDVDPSTVVTSGARICGMWGPPMSPRPPPAFGRRAPSGADGGRCSRTRPPPSSPGRSTPTPIAGARQSLAVSITLPPQGDRERPGGTEWTYRAARLCRTNGQRVRPNWGGSALEAVGARRQGCCTYAGAPRPAGGG
jgi:hypothetical protein